MVTVEVSRIGKRLIQIKEEIFVGSKNEVE